MAVFKRKKRSCNDSHGSSSSGGSSSTANCSLEKKDSAQQTLKSSLHSSESGSSAYNTCQSGSYRSCKSGRSAQKIVRFSKVHVREYERSLGDNPSCSSGAPIGIGWAYENAMTCRVEEYERKHKRGRPQNEIILTRQERERLLREWLTSEKEIAQSTRENLKVKFQRRRSVRNARKMEFFQHTIGKGLKKVLGIGGARKSDDMSLQAVPESGLMHQQSPIFEDSHEPEEDEDDESDEDSHPNPRSSKMLLQKRSSSLEDMIDDATSAVSGITFGDSTTTSAYEMEMFHRELELEMFGAEPDELDESLPPKSMLGQTLSLPEVESNAMSIVSGSHEEEMSSSSSTMQSFQSPNCSYYGGSAQMDISPVTNTMDYAVLQRQFPQQPPLYTQTHHMQYNPYAMTSAYRGYSLRDAYRGNNNKFSAFDVANHLQAPQFPPQYHMVEVTEPDDDEDDSMMLPRQSPYPLGAQQQQQQPHIVPPMYPPMDQPPAVPSRYISSDDNSRDTFSDVRSWEEIYHDLRAGDSALYSRSTDGYDSSTISMNLSNHSMSYNSYKSMASNTLGESSAEVSVDSFSERTNLTEQTQDC